MRGAGNVESVLRETLNAVFGIAGIRLIHSLPVPDGIFDNIQAEKSILNILVVGKTCCTKKGNASTAFHSYPEPYFDYFFLAPTSLAHHLKINGEYIQKRGFRAWHFRAACSGIVVGGLQCQIPGSGISKGAIPWVTDTSAITQISPVTESPTPNRMIIYVYHTNLVTSICTIPIKRDQAMICPNRSLYTRI